MLFYNNGNVYFVSDKMYNNESINTDSLGVIPTILMSEPKGKDLISNPNTILYIDKTFNEMVDTKLGQNFEGIISLLSDEKILENFRLYILNQVLYLDKKLYNSIYDYFNSLDVNIYPKMIFKNKAMKLLL